MGKKEGNQKIPKVIHYCWFSKDEKDDLVKKCIASWKKKLHEFKIKEWNTSNFDVNQNSYTRKMYKKKKWAFLTDYARFYILYKEGGIYLDSDVEVVKDMTPLLNNECFFGFESKKFIGAHVIGAKKKHWFMKVCFLSYNKFIGIITCPFLLTMLLKKYGLRSYCQQKVKDITIFKKEYFSPFYCNEKFNKKFIKSDTYSIHWWSGGWLRKPLFKKIIIFSQLAIGISIQFIKIFFKK